MSDYHMVQGVQLPGRLKLQQGETTFLNLTFTSFEVNAPVKDGYFTRPQ
jgi:hypothetical protein